MDDVLFTVSWFIHLEPDIQPEKVVFEQVQQWKKKKKNQHIFDFARFKAFATTEL